MPFSLCSSVTKLSESPGCTEAFHQSHGGRKLDKGNVFFTYDVKVGRQRDGTEKCKQFLKQLRSFH